MLNLPEDLPLSLRKKLVRRTEKKPEIAGLLTRLLEKRAATESEGERATIEKMLWSLAEPHRNAWLIVGAVLVVLSGVVGVNLMLEARKQHTIDAGLTAVAEVKRSEPGNCWFGSKKSSCVQLTLEVYPVGKVPYQVKVTDLVPNMYLPRVQSGAWLAVSINREDANEILIDERKLAEPAPTPPAER